ncbi:MULTISPECIES: response regulator [unclassified Tolypothrix]|uniref:response regulator n=1 Tax=unclassified Tolypothrix TaxID=2649714 RepID=UPI0005EAC360|nr:MULTISPECIES: response regulator [unclassified Tolypothrix]BAY90481.1 two-component response regulator [Microchaete diplosiphon NIES-3275]EKF01098.1 sensor histidine kinase [Tolypothrix sp. PCC 7601]MBE9082203.1 response regulator [Tolypothrix sp. LEGE 11397]UYD24646.1 response regulator [Tolypothrix sp. PCC 7712]UYD33125.1 response regulator [Tolypothrix sp. PCC 7601]
MTKNTEESHPQKDTKNFPSLDNLRVLLVDDNEDSLFLTTFILENQGFQVTTATSVTQALETIAESKFDILISDIAMPEFDGYSLIRKIRKSTLPEQREIPAIALTALSSDESRSLALASGFQSYVNKPVEPTILISEITRLINDNQTTT